MLTLAKVPDGQGFVFDSNVMIEGDSGEPVQMAVKFGDDVYRCEEHDGAEWVRLKKGVEWDESLPVYVIYGLKFRREDCTGGKAVPIPLVVHRAAA